MATSSHSIIVPVNFGAVSDLSDAVLTTLGTPTVYVAENSVTNPVTFNSVQLFVSFRGMSTATGGTITEFRAACTLSGAGASTFTETDDLTNTGESTGGVIGPIDFTSYFNTNYGTGASKACQVDAYFDVSTGTGLNTRQVYAWLKISYTYNTSEASRSQTVKYCYESLTGFLTTTANTAFCTIPQLTGVGGDLNGYNTPTIRQIWAEVIHLEGTANSTDYNLNYSFDGSGSTALPTILGALISACYSVYLIDLSSLSTTTTHTLDLWSSLASRFPNILVNVYVTFDYTVSGTTAVLVNQIHSCELASPIVTDYAVFRNDRILIPEASFTMKNSAVQLWYINNGSATCTVYAGAQSSAGRAYAHSSAGVLCGAMTCQHRLDSGGGLGASQTFVQGKNTIQIYAKSGGTNLTNVSGMITLLYLVTLSGSETVDNVSRIVYAPGKTIDFAIVSTFIDDVASLSIQIPESSYWVQEAGVFYHNWFIGTNGFYESRIGVLGGEGKGSGFYIIYYDSQVNDNEQSYIPIFCSMRNIAKRHPSEVDTNRIDIESARTVRTSAIPNNVRVGFELFAVYHTITNTVGGTISGSGGGTVTLKVFDSATHEYLYSTSRSGNGAYSVTVYDPEMSYYVVAYEDDTYKGRSKTGTFASDFDINLAGAAQKIVWG